MSKPPDNSEIYENIPCQLRNINDTNENLQNQPTRKSTTASTKELLYATPLRKSDRNKQQRSNDNNTRNNVQQQKTVYSQIKFLDKTEKLNNIDYKQLTKNIRDDNNILLLETDVRCSLQTNRDVELEECRIRNFLKDTSFKKVEVQNSNFSFLTKEEHFANLVQQNVIVEPQIDNNDDDNDDLNTSPTTNINIKTTPTTTTNNDDNIIKNLNDNRTLHDDDDDIDNLEAKCNYNLEYITNMNSKPSPNKTLDKLEDLGACFLSSASPTTSTKQHQRSIINDPTVKVNINREWVMKKIAMCLEQRSNKKPIPPPMPPGSSASETLKNELSLSCMMIETPSGNNPFFNRSAIVHNQNPNLPHLGCLVLGSNGSGKTSICQNILEGANGTRGILNRRLLCCYFVNSQNPECHSLSMFIRSLILQILSHSSYIERNECDDNNDIDPDDNIRLDKNDDQNEPQNSSNNINELEESVDCNLTEIILNLNENEMKTNNQIKSPQKNKKIIIRQHSEPTTSTTTTTANKQQQVETTTTNTTEINENTSVDLDKPNYPNYTTHPPLTKTTTIDNKHLNNITNDITTNKDDKKLSSPIKKVSKIPIPISTRLNGSGHKSISPPIIENDDGKYEVSDNNIVCKKEEIEELVGEGEIIINDMTETENKNIDIDNDSNKNITAVNNDDEEEVEVQEDESKDEITTTTMTLENNNETIQQQLSGISGGSVSGIDNNIPPPLPKLKSCRMLIANRYYEMLISNPDIFECLNVDNIEKNPDECFKKTIIFPLLELTPPKTALLLIVDSIDENYINDGTLITTLKGKSSNKSRNIAELLSNHIHLLPKWLFLVITAKKQNKHITKMFTGFKKITLDDLRKSSVVKDVQEYIINRLNTDFKGMFSLTKEIIESLNQLYIKSNGCILYLKKVLDGIKENFFTFREIKLIPCTLNGLYLYICQKSFNKKQFNKIRPILNILLACSNYVEKIFVHNCLKMNNFTIDNDEFNKRLIIMKNILIFENNKMKLFHNSFCDWLVDVKFSTKKFLCDVNEGHILISMYYTLVSEQLCPNKVRRYIHHLIKCGEYLTNKDINLDLILILLESKTNLSDCFYTNLLNCCRICEDECKNDINLLPKTKIMIEKFFYNELNHEFINFLCDFFKPNLPTDAKTLKLLIETGINNIDSQMSYESSLNSPELSEKSQNIDSELAELLISSEKSCQQEILRTNSLRDNKNHHHHHHHHQQQLQQHSSQSQNQQQKQLEIENEIVHPTNVPDGIELHKGKALIHILANEGNHLLLERALKACKDPIDLEIEDLNGQTALNIAARNGYIEVVKILLEFEQTYTDGTGRIKRIDVNHADRDGWSPLRSASWGGHTEVVKLLIANPECAIDFADREGRTALRAASWSGHEDILKILLESGANVNSIDKQGRTSLIAASYMGHYDIVEILLENGSDVNHLDLDGRSALCVAALCGSSGYNKVISTLLEHGANTDQLDNDGMSPLLISSFEGNSDICELLLENGADPDLADQMGRTSLWAACTAGYANVVKLLLFWGCGIDCMDSEGRTVLSIAAAQGNLETVRQLLDRGLDETHRDNAGWTPLHYGAFEGYSDICVQLLESGAKIDECDNEGKTALHLAAQEGHNNVIEALLDIHSACVDQRAHDGKTAFRLAGLDGHFECIQTLLKYGCDVNSKDADSRTTLYILALENKIKMVKFLFEFANVDVNIPDAEGRTALHVASWQGHSEMVKQLITMGSANVNSMDLECRTPLHSCAWQGNHEVMEILLYYGAMADHACKQGATALGICSQEGHESCVKVLLQYGANPFKSDHCGRTPIKLAAKSNRNNVMRILESFSKNESNLELKQCHPNLLMKSPDKPTEKSLILPNSQSPNLLVPNNISISGVLNATSSTQSSNFYENTMHSDTSSLQKRKSVVSNQSTESSNEAPISFTQQLQKHSRHSCSRSNSSIVAGGVNTKYDKNSQKFTQILPNVTEYQSNIVSNIPANTEADLFDCMSPLYATPPHSPSSDISSPGQHQPPIHFGEIAVNVGSGNNFSQSNQIVLTTDNHFARDTHMRIILGNSKDCNISGSKSKRSGIATNPAVRMIRSRFDSAAQVIRRANNMLSNASSSNNNQGSSSIGVKSSTFQWRKESQM